MNKKNRRKELKMKILPISNYQTQNQKKQKVSNTPQFGMILTIDAAKGMITPIEKFKLTAKALRVGKLTDKAHINIGQVHRPRISSKIGDGTERFESVNKVYGMTAKTSINGVEGGRIWKEKKYQYSLLDVDIMDGEQRPFNRLTQWLNNPTENVSNSKKVEKLASKETDPDLDKIEMHKVDFNPEAPEFANFAKFEIVNPEPWIQRIERAKTNCFLQGSLEHAARWANLMDEAMSKGKKLEEVARDAMNKADIDGISGWMEGMSAQALVDSWKHGEALKAWYNGGKKSEYIINRGVGIIPEA